MGISGNSIRKFGQKQWKIRAKAIMFARNICRRFPSFRIALAQIARIPHCFFVKFGQKQWKKLGKSNEKTQKAAEYISGENMEVLRNFTNLHIILKIYFLDEIKILKDLASSARNSQYT